MLPTHSVFPNRGSSSSQAEVPLARLAFIPIPLDGKGLVLVTPRNQSFLSPSLPPALEGFLYPSQSYLLGQLAGLRAHLVQV